METLNKIKIEAELLMTEANQLMDKIQELYSEFENIKGDDIREDEVQEKISHIEETIEMIDDEQTIKLLKKQVTVLNNNIENSNKIKEEIEIVVDMFRDIENELSGFEL